MNELHNDGKPGVGSRPLLPPSKGRRQAAGAAWLWATVTLSLISTLAAFTIWHLVRRGRVLRSRLGPVKNIQPLDAPEPEVSGPP